MTQSINDFFRAKKERSDKESAGIDWNRRKAEWLAAIDLLYQRIEEYVAEPKKQGAVTLVRRPKEITENHLGTYDVHELILTVGDEEVVFSPKGRTVIGAQGRV